MSGSPNQYRLRLVGRSNGGDAVSIEAPVIIQLICSWCFCSWNSTNSEVPDQAKFFDRLGERVRKLRKSKSLSQEDMISFGFSARHWQQIEAGRPITVTTLLRISEVFRLPVAQLLRGLDEGIYQCDEKPKNFR